MSLKNLVGRSLEAVAPDRAAIRRLLAAAQRNLADYQGDSVPEKTTAECFGQAQQLLADVRAWLAAHKPELV